jgi:hypothetical protein
MAFRSRTNGGITTTVGPSPKVVAPIVALYGLITVLTLNDGWWRLATEPFRAIGTILLGLVLLYGLYRIGKVLCRQAGRDIRTFFS